MVGHAEFARYRAVRAIWVLEGGLRTAMQPRADAQICRPSAEVNPERTSLRSTLATTNLHWALGGCCRKRNRCRPIGRVAIKPKEFVECCFRYAALRLQLVRDFADTISPSRREL